VGTAIATGHGVALADDSPASDSSSAGTVQSTDTAGTAGPEVVSPKPKTEPAATPATTDAEASATETTSTKTTEANTSTTVAPGVVVSAQTTTGTAGSTKAPESPTEKAEPTTQAPEPTQTAEPTETAGPKPTAEPDPTPNKNPSASSAAPTTKAVTRSVATVEVRAAADSAPERSDTVTALAASAPADDDSTTAAPLAARVAAVTNTPPAAPVAAPNPLQMVAGAVSNIVSSVLGWAFGPIAGAATPSAPAQAPLAWTLLAFVRREIDGFVSSLGGGSATNVALAATQTTTSLALAAAAANVPGFPLAGAQLSPSTQFVNWVTGNYQTGNPLIADTLARFGVSGTDIGVMWDNGMVDDPTTPYNEHQILMAFGDTFGLRTVPGEDWRFNVLMRSADTDLTNGVDVPDGEFGNGNMFGGMPLWDVPPGRPYENYARRIINPEAMPPGASAGITLIPTAGISLPTPGTQFGVTQYINFMSVTNWGSPGQWSTNFSGIAYSTDNGENWSVAPTSIRYNDPWSGNANFQQGAFVRPGDGYVYSYGTPNGRQGAAYVSRVLEKDILDVSKYDYYSKGNPGGWFGWGATPAGWQRNNPAAATPVFGQDQGACGVANAGNQVSEMSVQYNKQLKKYVTLYGDQFNNIVMRTSDTPQGTWSTAKVLMGQQSGGIYAPMMHPWSPSTMGTGTDLYWNLSWWGEYNVGLMRTDLTKV
jgi:hypothetical protein